MTGPFDREHTDAWCGDLLDVGSLNKAASDAVVALVEAVHRAAARGERAPAAACALVLGPAGAGKTHLFARWRRALGERATFVLVRPGIGVEVTPRYVLREAVDALARTTLGAALRQVDVVAARALAHATGRRDATPGAVLDAARGLDAAAQRDALEHALDVFDGLHPGLHVGWLERLLRVPLATSAVDRRALLTYLSGREPDDTQLQRAGLHEGLRADEALGALRTLSAAAAVGAPLVLVFDQLENLVGAAEQSQVRAYASLVSELHDTVPGAVVVQMALDAEWNERIRPALAAPQRTRVEARRLVLALPRPDECAALLRCWVGQLAPAPAAPFPAPFTAAQVRAWCTTPGITPRQLMIACREALAAPAPAAAASDGAAVDPAEGATAARDAFAALWAKHTARARSELDAASKDGRGVDENRLCAALYATLTAAGATAAVVADRRASHQLEVPRHPGVCRVFLLQEANARSAATKLARALETPGPVLVLRERAFPLPPSWKISVGRLAELRARDPAAVHEINREDAARMLALHDMTAAARSGDLTDAAGRAIASAALAAWIATEACAPARWETVGALRGAAAASNETPAPQPPAATSPAADGASVAGATWAALIALRVASVERILGAVRAKHPATTRREVLAELRARGGAVRWFGHSLVAGGAS